MTTSVPMRGTSNRIRISERGALYSLAYEVAGSGAPLILLHGLSASSRWWSRNVPDFAARFRTYAVDLPGFGASRRVHWSRLDDTVDRLAVWMGAERLSRAHVTGHSLGGAVAAQLAARHPERVDRLVLVNAAIRPECKRPSLRATDVVQTVRSGLPGFAPMLMRDLLRCHPPSFVAATVDALQPAWESHLARIASPTLVVWGEHDAIAPLALGRDIAHTVADARLIVLPNAGHNPMWESAEAFNTAVLRFLTDWDDTGTA